MKKSMTKANQIDARYQAIFGDISRIIDSARQSAARSVNMTMTAAYWLIGRHIVEFEQSGQKRAKYGTEHIRRLSDDLMQQFGRGFGPVNLSQMRKFYLAWPPERIFQTPSEILLPGARQSFDPAIFQAASEKLENREHSPLAQAGLLPVDIASRFPLPWSAYVRLLSIKSLRAREFYEIEALRGGWSIRQLERQINSQFYERTALSKNKGAMLAQGQQSILGDTVRPENAFKDPYFIEFLDLKDEYSESDLEEALIRHLETFLLELGEDFCFIGRQRRLRIGNEWYRVDLLFFHRKLRCLVVVDLKIGKFKSDHVGQMQTYLNYAQKHWVREGEDPPVGLILCAQKDEAVARYAIGGLPNKVIAAEYRTALPDEESLALEIVRAREELDARGLRPKKKRQVKPRRHSVATPGKAGR